MKTHFKFFALVLLLSFALGAYAQVSIGPKAGVNIATWEGDDLMVEDNELTSIPLLQFGLVTEFMLSDRVAIQPEFLYFQKGFGVETTVSETSFTTKTILNYIEVPVLVKVNLITSPVEVFVTAGPSFGYGLDGKMVFDGEGEKEEIDIDFEEDELSRLDLSASVGAGVQFPLGSGKLFVDGRYLLGLNTIDGSEPAEDRLDMKNRGIGIAAGFLFPLGQ
jgi:hypothetical protein